MAIFLVSVVLLAISTLDVVSSSHLRKTVGDDVSHVVVPDLDVVDSCVGNSLSFVEESSLFLVKVYVDVVKVLSFVARVVVVCRVMSNVYVYLRSVLLHCPQTRKMTTENDVGNCDSCSSLKLLLLV